MKRCSVSQSPELRFPQQDLAIPKTEQKREEDSKPAAQLIRHLEDIRIWYKNDCPLRKANLLVHLMSNLLSNLFRKFTKAKLYLEIVEGALEEENHVEKVLVGMVNLVTCYRTGIILKVAGYKEAIPSLLEKVLTAMKNLKVDLFQPFRKYVRFMNLYNEFTKSLQQIGSKLLRRCY